MKTSYLMAVALAATTSALADNWEVPATNELPAVRERSLELDRDANVLNERAQDQNRPPYLPRNRDDIMRALNDIRELTVRTLELRLSAQDARDPRLPGPPRQPGERRDLLRDFVQLNASYEQVERTISGLRNVPDVAWAQVRTDVASLRTLFTNQWPGRAEVRRLSDQYLSQVRDLVRLAREQFEDARRDGRVRPEHEARWNAAVASLQVLEMDATDFENAVDRFRERANTLPAWNEMETSRRLAREQLARATRRDGTVDRDDRLDVILARELRQAEEVYQMLARAYN